MMMGVSANKEQQVHKQMLMGLNSFDTDGKKGLSKTELENYKTDRQNKGYGISEFAQKLIEKFDQVDANGDGCLNSVEVHSLHNNRGFWQVTNIRPISTDKTIPAQTSSTPAASNQQANAKDEAFKHLLQQGYDKLRETVDVNQLVDKVL